MEAVLRKEIIVTKASCRVFMVFAFTILTALGAFVRIPLPFTPVPITLQTFFVLLGAALLGSNLGAITQLNYILLGFLGVPLFTGAGSGAAYLLGPTGGYLAGFVLASFFVARSIKYAQDKICSVFALLCLGDLILLVCGAIWLKFLFGYSLAKALFIGLMPFIPGDLLKALLAASIYLKLKARFKEIL